MTAVEAPVLERNLRALARSSPRVSRALAETPARPDVRFIETDDGVLSAEIGEDPRRVALASRRRPREEAERLAGTVDIAESAVVLVSGFATGHHVEALARRLKKTGVIVVFEPDLGLLRAVLERIDCSTWLGLSNVAFIDSADDGGELARLVDGIEGLVAMGVALLEHPPSRARIGDAGKRLHANFLDVVKAVKMTVVTTMVQVRATLRNLTQNLDRYAASPGVNDLAGACAGRPALVVSAGPSLARNIALLEDPRIRERFVIVAVQTVLKTLLARGIRPHFVTALDHSEISARFYEGLSAEDVRGVCLVVDPKVNPAVLQAWPDGAMLRICGDKYLDKLLGDGLAREKGSLPPGATVAHLAYYLARHLGCNPVALVGQDLGFTDGQYYAAGATIHGTWACELNEFNTLEMMEWVRILRMGTHLRRATDVLGRPVYTDEQMATYLVQFERDFAADAERGLTTIDATEGGVRKRSAAPMPLKAFIEAHAGSADEPTIEAMLEARTRAAAAAQGRASAPVGVRRIEERVESVRHDAFKVGELSRRAGIIVAEMLEHHADQPRVNRLIEKLERVRDEAVRLQPAFDLTQTLNQSGVFNRLRADRDLEVKRQAGQITPMEGQRRQLERDRDNLRTLARASDELGELLDDTLTMLRTGRRVTRAPLAIGGAPAGGEGLVVTERAVRIGAVVAVLGDDACAVAGAEVWRGMTALELTLARLARCRTLAGGKKGENTAVGGMPVCIATDAPERIAALLKSGAQRLQGMNMEILPVDPGAERRAGVRAARLLAGECWRGGIAGQTAFDEVFDARALAAACEKMDAHGVLLVGGDWAAVDPDLCDEVVRRFVQGARAGAGAEVGGPGSSRIAFTQAPPGLCGCVLARSLITDLLRGEQAGGVFASIGGVLGYIPATPIVDLIGLSECIAIEPALRDLGERVTADTARGRRLIAAALDLAGGIEHLDATAVIRAASQIGPRTPTHLVILAGVHDGHDTRWIDAASAAARITAFAAALRQAGDRPGAGVVTLRAADVFSAVDVLDHPALDRLLNAAADAGLAVHVRTNLASERFDPARLLRAPVLIASVDLLAESEAGYRAVTGRGGWERVRERLDRLIAERGGGWGVPWIVPRITRCDAAYADIDPFFASRLARCGWAVIDPLEHVPTEPNARIAPLPVPSTARRRLDARTIVIGVDGVELRP